MRRSLPFYILALDCSEDGKIEKICRVSRVQQLEHQLTKSSKNLQYYPMRDKRGVEGVVDWRVYSAPSS